MSHIRRRCQCWILWLAAMFVKWIPWSDLLDILSASLMEFVCTHQIPHLFSEVRTTEARNWSDSSSKIIVVTPHFTKDAHTISIRHFGYDMVSAEALASNFLCLWWLVCLVKTFNIICWCPGQRAKRTLQYLLSSFIFSCPLDATRTIRPHSLWSHFRTIYYYGATKFCLMSFNSATGSWFSVPTTM